MKRKSIKIICIAIAVLAIGAVIGWAIASGLNAANISEGTNNDTTEESVPSNNSATDASQSTKSDSTTSEDVVVPQVPVITKDEANLLSSRLTSRSMEEAELAWVDGAAPDVAPTGTTIVFDLSTFYAEGPFGRMNGDITMPGQTAQTWRFLLEYVDGQWLVYTSEAV